MRIGRLLGSLAIATTAFVSSPAPATQFIYDITGVTTDDVNDFYGYIGATLPLAQAFSLRFVVDDSVSQAVYNYGPTASSAIGGGLYQMGSATPVSATFKTGGYAYDLRLNEFWQPYSYDPITGDYNGTQILEHNLGTAEKSLPLGELHLLGGFERTEDCCGVFFGFSNTSSDTFDITLKSPAFQSADYRELGTFDLDPGSTGYFLTGYMSVDRQGTYTDFASAGLLAKRLTVFSAVPEPSTWMMMSVGIACVGFALRRRQRSVSAFDSKARSAPRV